MTFPQNSLLRYCVFAGAHRTKMVNHFITRVLRDSQIRVQYAQMLRMGTEKEHTVSHGTHDNIHSTSSIN